MTTPPEPAKVTIVRDGDTFHHKDTLKAMGAKWCPQHKAWYFEPCLDEDVRKRLSRMIGFGVEIRDVRKDFLLESMP